MKYPWGNAEPRREQACWNRQAGTCPLGSGIPGAFGLRDLAGNVWEWTSSRYAPGHGARGSGEERTVRGGSWNTTDVAGIRSTSRAGMSPTATTPDVGFRCVTSRK